LTCTVIDVPAKAGSVGVIVITPVDALIESHDGYGVGIVIEYVRAPQKVRPSIGLPLVKLRESFITAVKLLSIAVKLATVYRHEVKVTSKLTVEVIVG